MAKSKLTDKLIIAVPIIVAVIIVIILLFMGWKKTEGFTSGLEQKDNLIATSFTTINENLPRDSNNNLQQVGFDNPNTENVNESAGTVTTSAGTVTTSAGTEEQVPSNTFNPTYKSKVVLKDTYVIKQIVIPNITGNFRIGVKNTARNKITYVSSLELNHEAITEVLVDNSHKYVMMTMFNSTNEFKDLSPTDIYGNELVGDDIIVFTNNVVANSNIFIMGHLENEHYHDKHDTQKLENDIIQTDETVLEKPSTKTQKPYGITKMVIKIPVTNTTNTTDTTNTTNPTNTTNTTDTTDTTNIKVLFQNNYSNNSFTFEGPLPNREFIVNKEYNTIFFHHTLLANKVIVMNTTNTTNTANTSIISSNVEVYGYNPSIVDINRFKLEYNLTDVRGSINPDNICPSLDQYMNDQLNSEIVIDAMEYQDKISMEKMKLSNNKASMLTLLEQNEEIEKLERMITKIDNLHQQHKHKTNALNAIHLRRQMDEVLKLRNVLDNRIALREQNTINIPVDVNRVKVVDKDDELPVENLDIFADIPISKEENMAL